MPGFRKHLIGRFLASGSRLSRGNLGLVFYLSVLVRQNWSKNCSTYSKETLKDMVVKEFNFPVNSFSNLLVNCDFGLKVSCLMSYPASTASIRLVALQSRSILAPNFQIENLERTLFINAKTENEQQRDVFKMLIEVPTGCDVSVKGKGNCNVQLENLENKKVEVLMEKGNFMFKNLKSGILIVKSQGGDITCMGPYYGNCNLESVLNGNIVIDRFQGQSMILKTESGNVELKALYADKTFVETKSGNISLGNLHADCQAITHSGHIHASGLTGSLIAETGEGDIKVQASRPKEMNLTSAKGNISLNLSENIVPSFDLIGKSIIVDPHFNKENTSDRSNLSANIKARTPNGEITVGIQNWMSSLNLKST